MKNIAEKLHEARLKSPTDEEWKEAEELYDALNAEELEVSTGAIVILLRMVRSGLEPCDDEDCVIEHLVTPHQFS